MSLRSFASRLICALACGDVSRPSTMDRCANKEDSADCTVKTEGKEPKIWHHVEA
jgi:hypothetical protein